MGKRYAEIIETMWFTFLYATLIPIGAFISTCGLIIYYWVDKYNLLRRSCIKRDLSEQLVMTEDFDVFEAGTGAEGMEKAKAAIYDLVILDVGLPDTDGRELCRRMRKSGVKCPILMLSGHDSDADTILGLDTGANDYGT